MRPSVDGADEATGEAVAGWLPGLRLAVFVLLGLSLPAGERALGLPMHYGIALPTIAVALATNYALWRRSRRDPNVTREPLGPRALALVVGFDLVAIALVLGASGGAANPLSAVLLVYVAAAASLLPTWITFVLAALSMVAFGALFTVPGGSCCANHPAHGELSAHLYGMWAAFAMAAGISAYFLTRLRQTLDARGREILRLRAEAEQNARFAALGTLAAGTAHELGTPLGTIAVLAGEIAEVPESAAEHARSISEQVARCRTILTKMQGRMPARDAVVTVNSAVARAIASWRRAHPDTTIELRRGADVTASIPLGDDDIEAALWTLFDNARDAGASREAIQVEIEASGGDVLIRIVDHGSGIPAALVGRLGEPFSTTKEPGRGMGLGLYLVRTMLTRIGGALDIGPGDPNGTIVTLRLAAQGARS
jgi:two-component system sensor histidine kinase RegB